jgi:hypothetical protein
LPYKDPLIKKIKQAAYSKRWYESNKQAVQERSAKNRNKKRNEWQRYKETLSCSRCGIQHPAVIDFHHIDKTPPKRSVTRLVGDGAYALALEEIKKCIAVCSNCHRILHHEERVEKRLHRKRKKK